MSNDPLKKFLAAIAKDDYIEADKHFGDVVQNSIHNVINKRKPAILDGINSKVNEVATKTVNNED